MQDIDRRQFLIGTLGCCACAACPAASASAAPDAKPLDVGTLAQYAKDGITDTWAQSNKLFVVRHKDRIYAPQAICTHKRFDLVGEGDAIKCPKHGSLFSIQGKVEKGPARTALPRLRITVSAEGRLTIDPATKFPESKWNDPNSYVTVR